MTDTMVWTNYHMSFPFTHMTDTMVWTTIFMHSLILGLHFTYVIRDQTFLIYALIFRRGHQFWGCFEVIYEEHLRSQRV